MARRRRSRVTGNRRLARVLRRIEPEAREKMKGAMTDAAQAIHADMLVLTPHDTGNLRRLLDWRVSKNGMNARVGLVTKKAQREGFYFRFLDQGTKGAPAKNIPPQPARHIRAQAFDLNKNWALERVNEGIDKALEAAVRAGGRRDE